MSEVTIGEVIGREVGVVTIEPRVTKWQPTVDAIIARAKLLKGDEELRWNCDSEENATRIKANLKVRQHGLGAAIQGAELHVWKVKAQKAVTVS